MTKRNCMVQETGIAIEALADALDQERRKPFNGDICDLLEWATKDVFAMRQQLAEVTQYWEAAKEDNEQKRIYTMMLQQQLAAKQAEADQLRQHVTLLRDAIVAIWTNPNWKPDTMPRALIDQLQTAYKGELK